MKRTIVTLASYPKRIDYAYKVVENILLHQTVKPDIVVLNLFSGHFPDKKIPDSFSTLKDDRLIIRWHEQDMRSHNKFLYTFREYPKDAVITLDDDIDYPLNLIETLLEGHGKFPDAIITQRAQIMKYNTDGTVRSSGEWIYNDLNSSVGNREKWQYAENKRNKWLYFNTGAGTLFVPELICTDKFPLFNKKQIAKDSPSDDDLWINIAQKKNEVDVVLYRPLYYVHERVFDNTQEEGLWETVNRSPKALNLPSRLFSKYKIKNQVGADVILLQQESEDLRGDRWSLKEKKRILEEERDSLKKSLLFYMEPGIKLSVNNLYLAVKRKLSRKMQN